MSGIEMLTRAEFIAAAAVIVGGAVLALALLRPWRGSRDPGVASAELPPTHPRVTFADVAGLDEAIAELKEVADYLSDPERFRALGAELPRGILLYGMPGCGKTLLARALAGETGVPFHFVSAASFVEQFVGLGAARVRRLFEDAKRSAPSIVFIDELDAIGRRRDGATAGEREFDHTLNQLLVELDGFLGSTGVLILGATNRPELIDPALLRPGRFDRRIQVDRPDRAGREQILRLHAARRPFASDVDWRQVAAETAGLTPAELANVVNEASLLAARRRRRAISVDDVEEARSRLLSGTRSSRLIADDEKRLMAVHEAGHGLLSVLLRGVRPPARISIVSRAGTFTRALWSADDDREIMSKRELLAQLIVLLGGRAAEMNVFGQPSTRAEDDLEQAASLARRMVERWAMTGRFELAGGPRDVPTYRFEGSAGSHEVRELLVWAERAARTILGERADRLEAIAQLLSERETLATLEIDRLAGQVQPRAGRAQVSARLGVASERVRGASVPAPIPRPAAKRAHGG
ncbi:MAG: AAA family ATPase [Actinomycetota bacterium]|nr:AAA family ATPase [Actinomycetota bacterium]